MSLSGYQLYYRLFKRIARHEVKWKYTIISITVESRTALHSLLCVAGNFGKILSVCGQHEIQHTARTMTKCMYK